MNGANNIHYIKLWHLDDERDFYTPDGNYPHITSDGWFGGQVVFEPKTKKVYRPALIEVPKSEINSDFIRKCEYEIKRAKVSNKLNYEQIDALMKSLKLEEEE